VALCGNSRITAAPLWCRECAYSNSLTVIIGVNVAMAQLKSLRS
jgi:hypothetical protein